MDAQMIHRFIQQEDLPDSYGALVDRWFMPLLAWLARQVDGVGGRPLVLGINGAQGSGKTTLVRFLEMAMPGQLGIPTLSLSLDDFYLDRAARQQLGRDVHPLLATRGVPGTHDVRWLTAVVDQVLEVRQQENITLPVFDKASDDRLAPEHWRRISGHARLVLLEGWCVGTLPQHEHELTDPVNELEAREDVGGVWRGYVNDCLAGDYRALFSRLDGLLMLKAPDYDCILRWRALQERKLAARSPAGTALLDEAALNRFLQFFERLTRHSLKTLPQRADALLQRDTDHDIADARYRDTVR